MQSSITSVYSKLAKDSGALVAPVGPAWELARKLRPTIHLYDSDGSHPTSLGTYLSACVFYEVITGQSPVGLPHRLTTKDMNDTTFYLSINSREDAQFLQEVAHKIVNQYKQNGN